MRDLLFSSCSALFLCLISGAVTAYTGSSEDHAELPFISIPGTGEVPRWGELRWGAPAEIRWRWANESKWHHNGSVITEQNCSSFVPAKDGLNGLSRDRLRAYTTKAMAIWEEVANVRFIRVEDDAEADLLFGLEPALVDTHRVAEVNLELGESVDNGFRRIERAVVCLQPDINWSTDATESEGVPSLLHALGHEIGHVFGIDHTKEGVMSFRLENDDLSLYEAKDASRLLYGTP